jgi:hypothetical protein
LLHAEKANPVRHTAIAIKVSFDLFLINIGLSFRE